MRLTTNQPRIYLPDVVGRGYGAFWRFTGRYRVCKGSRASKKSTTTALNFIYRMMKYPGANLLVIRKTYRALRDSCFTQLLWAIHRLQVEAFWSWKESPLEITYKPTGQKIYFRGMDDPLKLTSITAQSGVLCWVWIEEAYEIMNESDFNTLDESIRGECAPPLFKQITLTFNPWNQKHWLKARFFDVQDPDILAITTNYQCNEWLDKQDLRLFERMKATNPRRYAVAGLGNWGIVEGLIYEHWRESPFDPAEISRTGKLESVFGLDFGFTNDPTALFCGLLDIPARRLYVFDELYERGADERHDCQARDGDGLRQSEHHRRRRRAEIHCRAARHGLAYAQRGERCGQHPQRHPVDSKSRNHHPPALREFHNGNQQLHMGQGQVRQDARWPH